VEDTVNTSFLSHLIVSFIYTKQILFASRLIIHLLKRGVHSNQENHFIDVARAFHTNGNVDEAFAYVERLKQKPELAENSDIWFLCGLFLQVFYFLPKFYQ
jgi:hypothetical protein